MVRAARRLAVEGLDERAVPAVVAGVTEGSLLVTGAATAPSGLVKVVGTAEATFQVFDGDTRVGEYKGVTRNVGVRLTDAKDIVRIDLGGFTLAGGLKVEAGGGNNVVWVGNGKVGKDVVLTAGGGADTFELSKVSVGGLTVSGGGGYDKFTFGGGARAAGLKTDGVEFVRLAAESGVGGEATILGPATGADVGVAGYVGGLFTFRGAEAGADMVVLARTGVLARGAVITTGAGNDLVQIDGVVGTPSDRPATAPPVLVIETGAGNDTVRVGEAAKLIGGSRINLGAGDDTFVLAATAKFGPLTADGGEGKDLFVGSKALPGLTLLNFEYGTGGDRK